LNTIFARLSFALLALCCTALPARAEDQTAAATNVPGAPTPAIHPDRSITFTLNAPDAATLAVAGGDGLGAGPFPMTKGADGTWSVTNAAHGAGFPLLLVGAQRRFRQ
jgi:hypothetical protein